MKMHVTEVWARASTRTENRDNQLNQHLSLLTTKNVIKRTQTPVFYHYSHRQCWKPKNHLRHSNLSIWQDSFRAKCIRIRRMLLRFIFKQDSILARKLFTTSRFKGSQVLFWRVKLVCTNHQRYSWITRRLWQLRSWTKLLKPLRIRSIGQGRYLRILLWGNLCLMLN